MEDPFISIVLPTFNRYEYLEKCVNAVLQQKYDNYELIIIDDYSDQSIFDFFSNSLILNNSKIRIHRNAYNKGLPETRNIGIALSRGDYILFIEDDLIIKPNTITQLIRVLKQSQDIKLGAICFNLIPSILIDSHYIQTKTQSSFSPLFAKKINSLCYIDPLTGITIWNTINPINEVLECPDVYACSLYKKEAIIDIGLYNSELFKHNFLFEETDLNRRLSRNGYKFLFCPDAIAFHIENKTGGCSVNKKLYYKYYVINYVFFVANNYGLRFLYMVPLFVITNILNLFKRKSL